MLKVDALCSRCHQILVLRTPVPTTPQHVSKQATNRTLYFVCGSPTNKMSNDEIWLASMVIYFPPQTFIVRPISWAFPRHILCLFWLYSLNYHTNCDLVISHQTYGSMLQRDGMFKKKILSVRRICMYGFAPIAVT